MKSIDIFDLMKLSNPKIIDIRDNIKPIVVDCISRQAVLDLIADYDLSMGQVVRGIHALPSVTPQEPKCKDCKWWKDSDGEYRRGCGAESKCPINRKEVYEGNGYCYLFEPQESEE